MFRLLLVQLGIIFAVLSMAEATCYGNDWFPWAATSQPSLESTIDLRFLNENRAGDNGWIVARDGAFVQSKTGRGVRFWGVNGPSPHAANEGELNREARMLAAYGVNLVRIHGAVFDERGKIDPARVRHIQNCVRAFAAEGIYTHLSIYFPLWLKPTVDLDWLPGFDGTKYPFSVLMFNPEFQERYAGWWRKLLLTEDDKGRRLVDEPALMGVEIQNEDSFFFWTFKEENIPDPLLRTLERKFGDWIASKYGSISSALALWGEPLLARDSATEGRLGLRSPWAIANERLLRDQDTARFLFELQSGFYCDQVSRLRTVGFRGLITASNWTTVSSEILGPLEKASYLSGDFIDRHGYFVTGHKGESAEWSIRAGHTYRDRSALRFEPEEFSDGKVFSNPVMEIEYNNMPSMISETTWSRPNRHRSEAPLYLAAYGALQGTDAIVHFAFDGSRWEVKPNFWMQPWTLTTPAMMGQFPAAALVYRLGLVREGPVLADLKLSLEEVLALKGTPLPQDGTLDELRNAELPTGIGRAAQSKRIDPLIHYAGRTKVEIGGGGESFVAPLSRFIDREAQTVDTADGQLKLDYGRGLLRINASAAQGVTGALQSKDTHELPAFELSTKMVLGHVMLVALDGRPIVESRRILLQVMSEERPSGYLTEDIADGRLLITDIGREPWEVRRLQGNITLRGFEGRRVAVHALDHSGCRTGRTWSNLSWELEPETIYYLIEVDAVSDFWLQF